MSTTTQKPTLRSVSRDASIEEILAIVRNDGGVIIKRFVTPEQVQAFNRDVKPYEDALAPGSKHPDPEIAAFHGSNTKRLTNLASYSQTFREDILDDDLVHDLCDAVFTEESGTYHLNSAQLISIGPGNKAQVLHRDCGNWYPFLDMGLDGPEVIVNFLIAFTDFTEENGATRVIPKSNHLPDFHDAGQPEETIPAIMEAGDALFFSGKTAHGGGANLTKDETRRAVALSFCPGFLMGEEAYPFMIDLDLVRKMPPRVQRIMDFRSHYPKGIPGLWQIDYSELADHLKL